MSAFGHKQTRDHKLSATASRCRPTHQQGEDSLLYQYPVLATQERVFASQINGQSSMLCGSGRSNPSLFAPAEQGQLEAIVSATCIGRWTQLAASRG